MSIAEHVKATKWAFKAAGSLLQSQAEGCVPQESDEGQVRSWSLLVCSTSAGVDMRQANSLQPSSRRDPEQGFCTCRGGHEASRPSAAFVKA